MNRPPALEVTGLTVRITDREILSGIDLTVAPGETVAVLGPSGSGKTTLLATIAGFFTPAEGEIRIAGELVASPHTQLPPERRSIGFVFQSYALWPHLSARDTVAFPWRVAGVDAAEARRRADALLGSLGIAELAERLPAEMSGGQQQRVGVARALAREADLFLLDEPTAHLDAVTRRAAEVEVAAQRRTRVAAALYATHDPAEALGAADRVVLLRAGAIVQQGSPVAVYAEPGDEWAARLTGAVSVLVRQGQRVAVRPEWVRLGSGAPGTIVAVRFRGPHSELTLETAEGLVEARVPGPPSHRVGEAVKWEATREWVLPG
ncbi:MAG TPA: ABC transporter ATP-binding protein [Actinobacteria bacterium]|nr:ABC transporter ATP-binding protein [Actinomycetota bacterium]